MRYLITLYRPDGFDFDAARDDGMMDAIDALNDAMVRAGIRVFVGGLQPSAQTHAISPQPGAEPLVRAGPLLPADFVADSLWVVDVAHLDEALSWGRAAATACRGTVEVRPIY